jgi:hypothetical protein
MMFFEGAIWIGDGIPCQFTFEIRCERPDWQLSSIVQIFGQQLPLLSHVEQLEITQHRQSNIEWTDDPDLDPSL